MPAYPAQRYKRHPTPFGGGGGGYRSSRTWLSPENQRQQEFQVIRNAMRRLFKKSEVAQMTYDDYIKHLEAVLASKTARLAQREAKEQNERRGFVIDEKLCAINVAATLPNKTNIQMHGNIGRVLGEKTIWCPDWQNGKEEIADWPSHAEMKWEGDDRAKTGVGRYPPLPRERGAIGITWGQLQVIEQYPIDQIAQIPTMEDVYLPVDEIREEDRYTLINKDLEDAMDAYLES
ncbi:hypothetical protein P280DRAFT_403036 [Massarina eburnea CBS 473.64]|uniref:Uncharacterized protein n=1 Tax=Massarina eburnea CBS 473.64 TaxID=1395130 RepID=A0A6A6RXI8_9PLEO|nr:hypothetical protein P280DRAFT_403036 [Massarina eburnea CBS 473.64]